MPVHLVWQAHAVNQLLGQITGVLRGFGAFDTRQFAADTRRAMNEDQRPYKFPAVENSPDDSYPSAVESLSGKWRQGQATGESPAEGRSLKRNSTMLGLGIGFAIVIFLAIVGGFLLLVWTVNR